ncbi:MAG TPA: 5-deoxy-glucuronate isomerase [Candidatus Limnocylindrales bacterium]
MGDRLFLRHPDASTGRIHAVDPSSAGWEWLTFDVHELRTGDRVVSTGSAAQGRERLLLVLEGSASVKLDGRDGGVVGRRSSVFEGPPAGVVVAGPGVTLSATATTRALIGLASAKAGKVSRTAVVPDSEILVEQRGSGSTARQVNHLLDPAAQAGRLIAFEVFTPAGNWSSYPPHKHDTEDPPTEALLEELYFYRFARPGAFGVQRVYTPDRSIDETYAVGDLDLVVVPRGYHPFGAPVGYEAYYLNVMAGPNRAWHFTIDPDHAWLMDWNPSAPTT